MEIFQRILKTAVDGGASDVHLKMSTPVIFRINRQLIAIECPFPTEEWLNNVVQQITPAHLRTARPVVPGHAPCENPRAQFRGTGPAGAD